MLIFGTYKTAPGKFDPNMIPGIQKVLLFNMYSIYDQGEMVYNLVPQPYPPEEILLSPDQLIFDNMYANYLMTNTYAFIDLMKIMYPLYENSDLLAYVLVGDDVYRDAMTQSLIKFIQERYGYISNYINDIEDIPYVQHSDFSRYGIMNLDADKEKFIQLMIQSGQMVIKDEEE